MGVERVSSEGEGEVEERKRKTRRRKGRTKRRASEERDREIEGQREGQRDSGGGRLEQRGNGEGTEGIRLRYRGSERQKPESSAPKSQLKESSVADQASEPQGGIGGWRGPCGLVVMAVTAKRLKKPSYSARSDWNSGCAAPGGGLPNCFAAAVRYLRDGPVKSLGVPTTH